MQYAAEEKAIIFSVPPYTTYLMQPLDKAIFGPLKISWRQVCHQFIVSNPAVRVNLFSEAWIQSPTLRNIIAGFCTTGVYPPRLNAIKLLGEELPNLSQKTGVAFYTRTMHQHSAASSTFTEEEQKLQAIHCYFVMAHKPCIFTVCCSMSVVSKTSCSQAVDIVVTRYR